MNNVNKIVKKNMCTGCGICSLSCPTNAIKMEYTPELYLPKINVKKCTDCGICLKNCYVENIREKNDFLKTLKIFKIHNNSNINKRSSSSEGFITIFASYLLEKKVVEHVIMSRIIVNKKKYFANSEIIDSDKKIFNYSGSIYFHFVYGDILKKINWNKKLLFVGKPCDIEAIKYYIKINKINANVKYISIFCHHVPTNESVDNLLKQYNADENLKNLHFRYGRYPGYLIFNHNKINPIPYKEYWDNMLGQEIPEVCKKCKIGFGTNGDISVGDYNSGGFNSVILINSIKIFNDVEEFFKKKIFIRKSISKKELLKFQRSLFLKNFVNFFKNLKYYNKIKLINIKLLLFFFKVKNYEK